MKNFLKKNWMWILYMAVFGAFAVQRAVSFFSPTETHLYYKILMIFSVNIGRLPLIYIAAIASIVMNGTVFIFLWFYIFDKRVFSAGFIVLILLIKIFSDLYGHSYEWNTIKSFFYESRTLGWQIGTNLFLWLLPSYLALIDYIIKKIKKPLVTT